MRQTLDNEHDTPGFRDNTQMMTLVPLLLERSGGLANNVTKIVLRHHSQSQHSINWHRSGSRGTHITRGLISVFFS